MQNILVALLILVSCVGLLFSQSMNISKKDGTTESYKLSDIQTISFSMEESGTVTDIDGNTYLTIKIGKQWWMAENLKVTHYRNGEALPNITDNSAWENLTAGAYCNYNNDEIHVDTYGRLYNWYAVNDSRGLAPEGWHVPSDDEWKDVEMFLGMSRTEADAAMRGRGTDESGKLKEMGTVHWRNPNVGATNESGFTALPGGKRYEGGPYDEIEITAEFWTSTETGSEHAWLRILTHNLPQIARVDHWKSRGVSVRCVKE